MDKFILTAKIGDTLLLKEEYTFLGHEKKGDLVLNISKESLEDIAVNHQDSLKRLMSVASRGKNLIFSHHDIMNLLKVNDYDLVKIGKKGFLNVSVAAILEYDLRLRLQNFYDNQDSCLGEFSKTKVIEKAFENIEVECSME